MSTDQFSEEEEERPYGEEENADEVEEVEITEEEKAKAEEEERRRRKRMRLKKRNVGVVDPRISSPFDWLMKAESYPMADAEFETFLEGMLPLTKSPQNLEENLNEEEGEEGEGKVEGEKELDGVEGDGKETRVKNTGAG